MSAEIVQALVITKTYKMGLLTNTEATENIAKQVIGSEFTGNLA